MSFEGLSAAAAQNDEGVVERIEDKPAVVHPTTEISEGKVVPHTLESAVPLQVAPAKESGSSESGISAVVGPSESAADTTNVPSMESTSDVLGIEALLELSESSREKRSADSDLINDAKRMRQGELSV